jgi:hypothetical protein
MAKHALSDQFRTAHRNIGLGRRRVVAIAAHLEVRDVLNEAASLRERGLHDVLIGSYPRRTGIWPGKDVDVFGKLTAESIETISPAAAYDLFYKVLFAAFGERIEPQARSVKINYRPDRSPGQRFVVEAAKSLGESEVLGLRDTFEFSVDVVPAVHFGALWGIPNRDPSSWQRQAAAERWLCTNPERLTELTQQLNAKHTIGGAGAYVPTVKSIRQIRRVHLGARKPGGLFMELVVYEGFSLGAIVGESWADLASSTLSYIAARLPTVGLNPLCDPALDKPYAPTPDAIDIAMAASVFSNLAAKALTAVGAEKCVAAAIWREIFGTNTNVNGPVFELPSGCTADGGVMPVFGTSADPIRGTNEARGFGGE